MTTITESFNTADSDTLGPDLTWTEVTGDIDIVSNIAKATSNGSRARAESDLASSDHYAQLVFAAQTSGNNVGPCVRFASAANTFYMYITDGRVFKCVSGSLTSLGSGTGFVLNDTARLEVNGSSLQRVVNGSPVGSPISDSAISGNTRCGFYCDNGYGADSFEAGDLSASGTTGDGSAAGSATASAVGLSTAVATGTAAGVATATAAGSSKAAADGSAGGSASATAVGSSTAVANGSAAGTSTAAAVSGGTASGDGSAGGSSTAAAAGSSVASATAAAAGNSSVAGSGKSTVVAAAVSAGLSTLSAIGFSTAAAIAVAAGIATAAGQSSVMSVSGPYRIAKAEAFVPTAVPQVFAGGAVKREVFPGGAAAAQSEPQ